jgi:hypothetical protein
MSQPSLGAGQAVFLAGSVLLWTEIGGWFYPHAQSGDVAAPQPVAAAAIAPNALWSHRRDGLPTAGAFWSPAAIETSIRGCNT